MVACRVVRRRFTMARHVSVPVFVLCQRCERRVAGAAGLEPVTSAVTGQRSNQLSYTPAMGLVKLEDAPGSVKRLRRKINPGSRRQGGGGGEPR